MIISADTESEYYVHESYYYEVYLDGVKQTKCCLANDEDGYIERYKTDSNGELIISSNGKELEIEKVYGDVLLINTKGERQN